MDRRQFIGASACVLAPSLWLPEQALAARFDTVRTLRLERAGTGERIAAAYWANGRLVREGYQRVNHLLRDVRANRQTAMAVPLLDVMAWVQAWFALYGWNVPLVINSGFRTIHTNSLTEGAAKNSLHVRGLAVDFTIPGVPSEYLGQLLRRLQQGGVGIYRRGGPNGFVHLDVGNVRSWRG